MDYKSVFTNLCLELQQNRSWIKGLGKNPQKSELIHWRQCLLSGGTEACSLGLRETPACIHVIQRLSQPRVACWHGFRQNSQKTECVFTRCPTGGQKKIACIYGLRSEGVKNGLVKTPLLAVRWASQNYERCTESFPRISFASLKPLRPIRRTKQLWLSVLLKYKTAAASQARIRTHILTTPELESDALHSCHLLQIFSNYYKFFQVLQKYKLLWKNFEFQVFCPTKKKKPLIKYHFMSILVKSRITIVKIRIGTHTKYFRTCSVL